MTNTGKVMDVNNDGTAAVKIIRYSACAMMHDEAKSCGGCAGCSADAREITVRAGNPECAKKGDIVELYSDTKTVLRIALLVFLLPIVAFFAAFFPLWIFINTTMGFIAGIAAMTLCFLAAKLYDRKITKSGRPDAEITRVLHKGEQST